MGLSGNQKFAVLLCKFSDTSTIEPYPSDFYKQLIVERGTGGLNDYWTAASQNAINLDGSQVFAWRTIQQTKADFLTAHPARWDKITGAIAAFPDVDTSKFAGIIAIYNVDVGDAGNAGNGVLASPTAMSVTFLGHESGHVFGLQHSFDQSSRKDASWSAPGEYFDMYDIMSAMNVYDTYDPRFQQRGPLLCAANLDRMGWLNSSRVWSSATPQSSWSDSFDLVSMSHPEIPGFIAAHVGPYYVEFRTQELWDVAIPRAGVLIHIMSDPNAVIIASDLTNYVDDWQPGQTFGASDLQLSIIGGVQIRVVSFDLQAKKARINARIVARRPIPSVGPGQILGGVASDGGGWLILNGQVIPIPPRSPVMSLAEAIANYVTAETNLGGMAAALGFGRAVGG
jgi:hypothetical protein